MINILEGVTVKNLRGPLSVQPVIFTAGQPTEAEIADMGHRGIRTVINLRPPSEQVGFDEARLASDSGMAYVGIPVAGAADLTIANAERLANTFETHSAPFFLHCAGGNRAGALLAVKVARIDGYTVEQALNLGVEAGMTDLYETVETLLR